MIGGTDIVIPAIGDPADLEACTRIVQRHWPQAVFEDGETGDRYSRDVDIPVGRVRELFAYPDEKAAAAWDTDRADSPPNSMLYLILSPNAVTVVLDDPNTPEMQAVIELMRSTLRERLLSPDQDARRFHVADHRRQGL